MNPAVGGNALPDISDRYKQIVEDTDWIMVSCIALITLILATLSVLKYTSYHSGIDLAHMTQAVWSSTQGRPLEFSYRGDIVSRLSLHAEFIYFLLAPFYALFPSPITLLIIQASLFGIGAFPLYRLTKRRTGKHAARWITLIYLLYPSAHMAVLSDFHGDTLSIAFLMFALEAMDREAWMAYGLWLLLSLSCKWYIAAPVCAIGAFLWLKHRRRIGLLTLWGGLMWGAIVFFVVRPSFTPPTTTVEQLSTLGYIKFYYGGVIRSLAATALDRIIAALLVFAPLLPLVCYAPDWAALALAVATPILISSGPGPTYNFSHYRYAMVVPFIIMVVVHAIARLKSSQRSLTSPVNRDTQLPIWSLLLEVAVIITLLINLRFIVIPQPPKAWAKGFEEGPFWIYQRTSRDAVKDHWLNRHVPDDAPLVVSHFIAPHLVNRRHIYLPRPLDGTEGPGLDVLLKQVEYAVLDGLFDHPLWLGGDVTYNWDTIAEMLRHQEYGLVSARDGLLLFQRRMSGISDSAWTEMTLTQSVTTESINSSPTIQATFADRINLIEGSVTPLGNRRYLLRYVWTMDEELSDDVSLFAVTHLSDIDQARTLHLPTTFLHPTPTWAPGEKVIETFEVELPRDIASGRYTVLVGWYDSSHRYAYATDGRSRVGDVIPVATLEVTDGSETSPANDEP